MTPTSTQKRPAEIIKHSVKGGRQASTPRGPILGTHTHPTQHDRCSRIQSSIAYLPVVQTKNACSLSVRDHGDWLHPWSMVSLVQCICID